MFIQGSFIGGGIQFIREKFEKDELTHMFPQTEIIVVASEKIEKLVQKGKFMVFMKGSPTHPMCLESKKFMNILSKYPYFMS